MKRTKEAYFRQHPNWEVRQGVSGLRDFDGEDLNHDSRVEYFKEQQRVFVAEQTAEKQARVEAERFEEQLYAKQTHEITRMRGLLEDQFLDKKKNMLQNVVEENQRLAQEKKERDLAEKRQRLDRERLEVTETLLKGTKLSYP